jgi:hypothetical protein
MRNGARKRGNRTSGSRNPSLAVDEIHSSQVPCCELIREVIADVFPEAIESVDSKQNQAQPANNTIAHSLFGSMLRNHFVELRKQQQQKQRTEESITTTKKRNRKKKKRISETLESQDKDEKEKRDPSVGDNWEDPKVIVPSVAQESKHIKLVREWTDRIIAQSPKTAEVEIQHRSLASFLECIAGVNPAISIDEIGEHVLRITCPHCRTHAEAYWQSTGIPAQDIGIISGNGENMSNRRMCLHPNMITSSGVNLHLAGNQDEVYERAFDYVPLEEGYGATEEFDGGAWLLESTIDLTTTRPSQLEMQQPIDLSGLERLTRDLILPCGLPHLDKQDSYILTDAEYCAVLKRFSDIKGPIASTLHEMDVANNDIKAVFHEISSMLNRSMSEEIAATKLDVILSKRITKIDEQCDSFLSELFKLLLLITEYNDSNHVEWACSKIDRFWTAYSQGTNCIIQELFAHEERSIQNAGSCGRILIAAVCPSHRRSLLILLDAKIRAILAIHDQIFPTIGCECEEGGSFLNHVLINYSFSYVITKEITTGKSGLDDVCEKLLVAYNESSVTIVNGLNVEGLLDTQKARTNKVTGCLTEANAKLEEVSIILGNPSLEKDMLQWKALQERYEEILTDVRSIEKSEEKDIGNDICTVGLAEQGKRLGCLVNITVMKWRLTRRLQMSMTPTFRLTLPLRLKEWIATEEQSPIILPDDQLCTGNGGKRRLVCIIAALYYQWLVARCKEWHAELIQKELLSDSSLVSDINSKDSKVRPSSAKNKKKKGSLNAPILSPETLEEKRKDATIIKQVTNTSQDRNRTSATPILIKSKMYGMRGKGNSLKNEAGTGLEGVLEDAFWIPTGQSKALEISSKRPEVSKPSNTVPQLCLDKPLARNVNNSTLTMEKGYEKVDTLSASFTTEVDATTVQICSNLNNISIVQPLINFGNITPEMQNTVSLADNEVDATLVKGYSNITKTLQVQPLHNFDDKTTVTNRTFPEDPSYKQDEDDIEIMQVGVTSRYGFKLAEDYLNSRFDSILELQDSKAKIKVIIL